MRRTPRLHHYGDLTLKSQYCSVCRCRSFVIDGERMCCHRPATEEEATKHIFEVCRSGIKRSKPPVKVQEQILEDQANCCLYCYAKFGSIRQIGRYPEVVDLQWDHILPFCYTQRNCGFAAACGRCNRMKSGRIFETIQEIQAYCQERYETSKRKADSDMPGVRRYIQEVAKARKILLTAMPVEPLEPPAPKIIISRNSTIEPPDWLLKA